MSWSFAPFFIINAAIENGIFDALAAQPSNAEDLASRTGCSVRGVAALAHALLPLALLTRDENSRYSLTPDAAAFLVSSKPSFFGGMFRHIHADLIPHWMQLSSVVRTGKPAAHVEQPADGIKFFEQFVSALFPVNYGAARALAEAIPKQNLDKILDIAAGSGVWGIAAAQSSPQARVTAVDWEPVLRTTRNTAEQSGVADRFSYLPGDIHDVDFGSGYGLATLGHILHSEGAEQSRRLLEKTFHALRPGGTIAIAEFLTNAERTGPLQALIFGVNMLVNTGNGTVFSFEEIHAVLLEIGFTNARTLQVPAPSPLILADKPLPDKN
jgi:2-polyprenyl-3-methyl-5-hydroxy-6-metoxy-1,4-benzoquinol methylase